MPCTQWARLNGITIDGEDLDAEFILMQDGISGLGFPDPKPNDLVRLTGHGSVGGVDYTLPRILRIPTVIANEDDPAAAMVSLRALKDAWAPADDGADQALTVFVEGQGPADHTLTFFGRPRGTLSLNLRQLHMGVIYCLPTFEALDPLGYGGGVTEAGSGAFTVTNTGNSISDRAIITITGNGGVPTLINNSDETASIVFSQALAGTAIIDLHAGTVVDGSGSDLFASNVLSSSTWPRLVPGVNTLVLAGAASASVLHSPGWW